MHTHAHANTHTQVVEGGGMGEELCVASSFSVLARLLLHAPQAFTSLLATAALNPAAVQAAVGPVQVRVCVCVCVSVCVNVCVHECVHAGGEGAGGLLIKRTLAYYIGPGEIANSLL
jgi:hypothetical protein